MQNPTRKRRLSYYFGHLAEQITALYFVLRGYRVLARRFKTPVGEIDLIVRRGEQLAFVEVKARRNKHDVDVLTPQAQRRITDAARLYIAKHAEYANFTLRFDVVIWHGLSLTYHKHAWFDDR